MHSDSESIQQEAIASGKTSSVYPTAIREMVHGKTNIIGLVITAICAIGLSFLSAASPFSTAYPSVDSSVFTYIGEHILQGQMPYRDIFDHKGPLLYIINTIAAILDGPHQVSLGLWACELVAIWSAMWASFFACRRFSGPIASTIGVVLAFSTLSYSLFGGNYTEEFAFLPVAIAIYLFSGYFIKGPISRAGCIGVGLTAGAAFLLQPNMLGAWAAFGLFILIHMGMRNHGKRIVPTIAWALLGFVGFCAPFLIWIAVGGAWDAFIDCYFHFNSEYASTFGYSDFISTVVWQLSYPTLAVSLVCLVLVCIKQKHTPRLFWVCYLIAFAVALGFSSLSGRHYTYYLMTMIPYMALPMAGCLSVFAGCTKDKKAWFVTFTIIACIVLAGLLFLDGRHYVSALRTNHDAANILSTDDINNAGSIYDDGYAIVDKVDELTAPDDKIVVCFADSWIFVESDRSSASRYIFQPEDTRLYIREQLLWEDVQANQPKLVIIPQGAMYFLDYLHGLPGYEVAWSDTGHVIYERID